MAKKTERTSVPAKKKKSVPAKPGKEKIAIHSAIVIIRETPVMLADDLARFFESTTKAVNQYRSRNADRFSTDYAFQLSREEWENLKSQSVTSSSGHGGSRTAPWAYTEHGVAMMSMGMKSENAIRLSKVIIDTFVDYRKGTLPSKPVLIGPKASKYRRALLEKIYKQMMQVLDTELPTTSGHTVREELSAIATKALGNIKAVIDKPALANEKVSAEVSKILAEAEKFYAEARKINVETDTLVLQNYRARMEFLRDLREMAQQLERDDWTEMFEESFGEVERDQISIRLPAKKGRS